MGLLKDLGAMLSPQESQKLQEFLKKVGIKQFLNVLKLYREWNKKGSQNYIKWGQQIQGNFLTKKQNGQLQLCRENLSQEYTKLQFPLMFEYGSWMFQMIPAEPYNTSCNFNQIVISIRNKYKCLQAKSRIPLTIPCIPLLGVRNKQKQESFVNTITNSLFIDDNHIAKHPRFPTLTKNIRIRRGQNVQIKVPLYKDQNTIMDAVSEDQPYPGYIYMDAMAFGMGLCCLQCTFSTKNLSHARYIYDQLHVISPIFLALTAGTPFHKGKIADWDVRWKIIQSSVDDRNKYQRDSKSEKYLPTSRYSPAQWYIWQGQFNRPQFNDVELNINQQCLEYILKASQEMNVPIDKSLAIHLANIFKRDILIVHQKFKQMTQEDNLLFEMLNGTNWNSVRLKIPTDQDIGWRVQFRTMEVMLTADQNSAFSLIIHLITRALHYETNLNFYIPMSAVMQNFERAHKNDAVRKQKFFFRTNIFGNQPPIIEQLTIQQILFGKDKFLGIYNLIENRIECCVKICPGMCNLLKSLKNLLLDIASGKRLTLAQWMRNYVYSHPLYKKDSILPKKLIDDLLYKLNDISTGRIKDQNFPPIFQF